MWFSSLALKLTCCHSTDIVAVSILRFRYPLSGASNAKASLVWGCGTVLSVLVTEGINVTIAVGKMFGKGRVGKMLGAGAAVALSLGALSTAAASPALAAPASAQGCTVTNSLNSGNVQAKVDNCPGSGVSWGWIYVASGKQYTSGDMYVKLADGSTGHIGTTAAWVGFRQLVLQDRVSKHVW